MDENEDSVNKTDQEAEPHFRPSLLPDLETLISYQSKTDPMSLLNKLLGRDERKNVELIVPERSEPTMSDSAGDAKETAPQEEVKVKEEENKEEPKEDNGKHDDECLDEEMDSEDDDDMDDMDGGEGGEGSGHQGEQGGASNEDYKLQLFLQFPGNNMLDRDGIKALHPDITDVEMPNSKHRRFCWVTFATREKAEKGLSDLSSVRLEGGKFLRVSWKENPNLPRRFRKDPEGKKKWILIKGFPKSATAEDLKESFFGVHRVQMGKKKNPKKLVPPGTAVLVFNSIKNAVDFMENKEKHVYKGHGLQVKYLKEGPSKKALKRKERNQRKKWEYQQRFQQSHGNYSY